MKKRFSVFLICILCTLTIILAACGADTGNQPASATTAATATSSLPTPTPGPTQSGNGNSSFVIYTGKGYTISYYPTWQIASDGSDGVIFQDSQDPTRAGTALHVLIQNNPYPQAALQLEEGTSMKDRCKPSRKVPATITINGITWQQSEFVCSSALANGSDQEIRALEMQKPIGNTYYAITWIASPQNFDNAVNGAFQIMTASFKVH